MHKLMRVPYTQSQLIYVDINAVNLMQHSTNTSQIYNAA